MRKTMGAVLAGKDPSLNTGLVRFNVLRLYAKFEENDPILSFQIDKDDAIKVHPRAIGLLDRDKIRVRLASLGIQSVLVRTVNDKEKRLYSNSPILHHADANYFDGPVPAGSYVSEAEALEMLYNAKMSIVTDETNRQDELDTSIFKFAGTTQHSSTTVNEYAEGHIQDLGRDITFVGGDMTEIQIKLENGDFAPAVGSGERENYAVLQFYSVVTKNAAKKRIR